MSEPRLSITLSNIVSVAAQCRSMGLVVGDTIVGRETYHGDAGWHEAELTLLWLGGTMAVWRERTRSKLLPIFSTPQEVANWDLGYREWKRVQRS